MTEPEDRPPGATVRVITFGTRGRFLLALLLLVGGAIALVLGTTLLITLLAAGVVLGAVGAVVMGVRRLVRGGAQPQGAAGKVRRADLDPSMEVFPDRTDTVRGSLKEGDDGDK